MPDAFVFSNFAVSTLVASVGVLDTTLQFNVDDVPRFPALSGGSKFPIVLADSDDITEIMYVTALSVGGVATVERGREGTLAQSWLAGTLVQHTFTAATVRQAAGFTPRGAWSSIAAYNVNDLVEHGGVTYIAVAATTNSEPTSANPNWQAIYNPEAGSAITLTWLGRWSAAISYSPGQVVEYQNRIWQSKTSGNLNIAPAVGNANWEAIARWSGHTDFMPVLTFLGSNNYNVTIAADEAPTGLFEGMQILGRFQNANTGPATLTITAGPNTLAAAPVRLTSGAPAGSGDFQSGPVYLLTYSTATTEFLATSAAGSSVPAGTVSDFAGSIIPTGWLLCDGSAVSRTTYARLFSVIGTTFGVGNGSTTFNLPDARGRVTAGLDGGTLRFPGGTLGVAAGAHSHTLSIAEMPQHTHAVDDPGHTHGYSDEQPVLTGAFTAGGVTGASSETDLGRTTNAAVTGIALLNAGSSTAHNNIQPTLVLNKIIKV